MVCFLFCFRSEESLEPYCTICVAQLFFFKTMSAARKVKLVSSEMLLFMGDQLQFKIDMDHILLHEKLHSL